MTKETWKKAKLIGISAIGNGGGGGKEKFEAREGQLCKVLQSVVGSGEKPKLIPRGR